MGVFPHPPTTSTELPLDPFLTKIFLLNPLFELCHMGDDAHQAVPRPSSPGRTEMACSSDSESRGRPFVPPNMASIWHPARVALDHVRRPKARGKGRLEDSPPGERRTDRTQWCSDPAHIQFQAGLAYASRQPVPCEAADYRHRSWNPAAGWPVPPPGRNRLPVHIVQRRSSACRAAPPLAVRDGVPDHSVPAIQLPRWRNRDLGPCRRPNRLWVRQVSLPPVRRQPGGPAFPRANARRADSSSRSMTFPSPTVGSQGLSRSWAAAEASWY